MDQPSKQGVRHRIRSRRSTRHAWRVIVFVTGLFFILLGVVLVIFPGPLTIPPILLGFWIWSTEFDAAKRQVERFEGKAREGWQEVKDHPIRAGLVTGAGVVALVVFVVLGGPGWVTDKVSGVFD